ncbi:hypothetical protein BIW11_03243 [Tropilaelaps mercedesae]|uniref:Uncharacterized protein n=1 Tax=Tropilaelaps mercedesae TaxID=418985 RepID=A0A1V9XPX9_9ACAR|nr:hypothetical protein BIW11_03243 [Tropilaelaps mercedesae]
MVNALVASAAFRIGLPIVLIAAVVVVVLQLLRSVVDSKLVVGFMGGGNLVAPRQRILCLQPGATWGRLGSEGSHARKGVQEPGFRLCTLLTDSNGHDSEPASVGPNLRRHVSRSSTSVRGWMDRRADAGCAAWLARNPGASQRLHATSSMKQTNEEKSDE